jgi:NAD(P)-dependent dehydrogenase (short-subunit alcohol dehydrogenase family)
MVHQARSTKAQEGSAMRELRGRVAVVTGAGSGIGRGMTRAFANEGMHLVLADVEAGPLDAVAEEVRSAGAKAIAVVTDVSDPAAVEALAAQSFDAFGAVHVLCNNAGVLNDNVPTWESSVDEWNWVLGVNLMGVAHGIHSFVPKMIEGGEPGHIVNTASMAGLMSGSANAIYFASKHAVVAISECVQNELNAAKAPIGVSVLCPGPVQTEIVESDRNRPDAPVPSDKAREGRVRFRRFLDSGVAPDDVGRLVADGIVEDRFYLLTHPHWDVLIRARFEAILEGKAPAAERFPKA